jgi:hypothetical protein
LKGKKEENKYKNTNRSIYAYLLKNKNKKFLELGFYEILKIKFQNYNQAL